MHKGEFVLCCKDLEDAMTIPPTSLFRVEENLVLYMAIGYSQTPEGLGWFDQAIIFCPFCGTQIQDHQEIRRKPYQL